MNNVKVTLGPECNWGKQLETGEAIIDDSKGGENMKKLYLAIIFDTQQEEVTGEQYVVAGNREQAFARVDTNPYSSSNMKVFLNEIGSYERS